MKQTKVRAALNWFFGDKRGRWVIVQSPNILISIWGLLLLVNILLRDDSIALLQSAVLFAWAYLEITQGASYFRRVLGVIVITGVIIGYFSY